MSSLLKICLVLGLVQVMSSNTMVETCLSLVRNANMFIDTSLLGKVRLVCMSTVVLNISSW
jgi:type III secretory pathway component EscS